MIRRLFKTGNSIVLSLPRDILDQLGLRDGESVNLEMDTEQKRLVISPVEKPLSDAGVNEEFARQVDGFIREYRQALTELAR
jgi:antitoxin component of MazEF toxin-antitoxin module